MPSTVVPRFIIGSTSVCILQRLWICIQGKYFDYYLNDWVSFKLSKGFNNGDISLGQKNWNEATWPREVAGFTRSGASGTSKRFDASYLIFLCTWCECFYKTWLEVSWTLQTKDAINKITLSGKIQYRSLNRLQRNTFAALKPLYL